jgi:predicted metal-dependent peptidase
MTMNVPALNLTVSGVMAAARYKACSIAPYFADGLLALIPMPCPGFGTFAVSEHGHLIYDPDVVLAWGVDVVCTVYLHELQHVLRNHAQRARSQGVSAATADAWGQAVDAEINDDLVAMKLPFPDGRCVLPSTLSKTAPDGLSAEEYYLLLPIDNQGCRQPNGKPGVNGSGGTGIPLPQEPDTSGPNAVPGRTPADMQLIRNQCADKLQKAKNMGNNGSIPGGFLRWAEEVLAPPPYDWKQHLETRANNVCAFVRGKKSRTYSQQSRRQGIYGYGSGVPVVAARRSPIVTSAIMLDTSGSMDDDDIAMGLGIIGKVLQHSTDRTMFLSCDAAVNTLANVRSLADVKKLVVGGGGTDFRPGFAALAKDPPAVLFVLTDGDGPAPALNHLHTTEIVWVLIGDHAVIPFCDNARRSTVPYGEIVWASDEARKRNRDAEGNRKRVLPEVADDGDGQDDDDDDDSANATP